MLACFVPRWLRPEGCADFPLPLSRRPHCRAAALAHNSSALQGVLWNDFVYS